MNDPPFPMALPAPAGEVVTLTHDLVQPGIEQSRLSPRLRIIQPLHKSDDASLHRMFNVMQPEYPQDWIQGRGSETTTTSCWRSLAVATTRPLASTATL